jgi:hypothetical protein
MSRYVLEIGLWAFSALMLLVQVLGWIQTAKLFKTSAWSVAKRMFYFVSKTKYFVRTILMILSAAVVAFVIVFSPSFETPIRLALATPFIAVCFALLLRMLQPPVVLFLTSSSPHAARLLGNINRGLTPLRAVGLLDPLRIGFVQRFFIKADNLRTSDPYVWKSLVCRLIDITPIVIIDTRGEAEPVCQETLLMLHPKRVRKALFITDDDGLCRSLEVHGIDPAKYALPRVTESDLISQLRYWTQKIDYLPCPFDPRVLHDEANLVPENIDTLSSVLIVMLFDEFDSSALIEMALNSNKKLLTVYGPFVVQNEQTTQWAFNISWHFVHNPKLVLVRVMQGGQFMIRIQFLREIHNELSHFQAKAQHKDLTFGQLNQPEPILANLLDFSDELIRQASKRGLTFQDVLH